MLLSNQTVANAAHNVRLGLLYMLWNSMHKTPTFIERFNAIFTTRLLIQIIIALSVWVMFRLYGLW